MKVAPVKPEGGKVPREEIKRAVTDAHVSARLPVQDGYIRLPNGDYKTLTSLCRTFGLT